MPPTKAMGATTQNRRSLPTATPLSTLWYSGVVRLGRARERRHRLLGCIFWAKFGWPGGFDNLAESRWEDRIGPSILVQKSTIPQSTVGGLFMFGESAVGWNSGPVCGDGNWGEYSTLKGGGRHGQLVTGRSISMAPPARMP
jgi:hypothetical protein